MNKYRVSVISPQSDRSNQSVYVDANNFEVLRDGSVIFTDVFGGRIIKAIASGWWCGVELVKWNSGSGSWEGGEE